MASVWVKNTDANKSITIRVDGNVYRFEPLELRSFPGDLQVELDEVIDRYDELVFYDGQAADVDIDTTLLSIGDPNLQSYLNQLEYRMKRCEYESYFGKGFRASKLKLLKSLHSSQLLHGNDRKDLQENSAFRHDHTNKSILDAINSAGSGLVITSGERSTLSTVDAQKHTHTNKAVLDAVTAIGLNFSITSVKIADYSPLMDELVRVDPSGGAINLNLPQASVKLGGVIRIKNVTNEAVNAINLVPNGTDEIDSVAATKVLTGAYLASEIISNGVDGWMVMY